MNIRSMKVEDIAPMAKAFGRPVELMRRYSQEQAEGKREVLVAILDDQIVGYGTVCWQSPYPPFRQSQVPEIVDLNVLAAYRNRGVGSRLLDSAESLAGQRSPVVGIGVGLYKGYGPAQHIYARRGYVPDGRGVVYNGRPVSAGTYIRVDDSLTLQLVKSLKAQTNP